MANQDTQQLDQQLRQLFGAHTYSEGPLAVSGAGRRFVGLDLCHPLNLDQVTFILDAWSKFRIISIAGQDLTAFSLAHFERFANHWGAPVPHPNNFLRGGKSAQSDGDSDGEFELIPFENRTASAVNLTFPNQLQCLSHQSPAVLVADTLLAENNYDLLLVEPNLEESTKYDLTKYNKLNGSVDIVAYLVAHKEFKGFKTDAQELDFCGVKK